MKISEFMQYAAGVMLLLIPLWLKIDPALIMGYYWVIFAGAAIWSAVMWRGNR